jgi:hypothetical protein
MEITPKNLFKHYIFHPFANELSPRQKAVAFIASALLCPITIPYKIGSFFWSLRKVSVIKPKAGPPGFFGQLQNMFTKPQPASQHPSTAALDIKVLKERENEFKEIFHSNTPIVFPVLEPHDTIDAVDTTPQETSPQTPHLDDTSSNVPETPSSPKDASSPKPILTQPSNQSPPLSPLTSPMNSPNMVSPQQSSPTNSLPTSPILTTTSIKQFSPLQRKMSKLPFSTADVRKICNEKFIHKYYSKPLLGKDSLINMGHVPFLEGDPRKNYGNDHCVRATVFAGLFAYMYQKYSPGANVSAQEFALCQVTAAGYDCGRKTEGLDVYSTESAELTKKELQELGLKDEVLLSTCFDAIAKKGAKPDHNKSLVAKCVQNAESAEDVRFSLISSPIQDPKGFETSREMLDIYKELKALAEKECPEDPSKAVLKDGRTFGEFCTELDSLRKQMNDLIHKTQKREFREAIANSGDCYRSILNSVTPTEFPGLNHVMTQTGIKPPRPTPELLQKKKDIAAGEQWMQYGVGKISTESLEKIYRVLERYPDDKKAKTVVEKVVQELDLRSGSVADYRGSLSREPFNLNDLIECYSKIPQILKKEFRVGFVQELTKLGHPDRSAIKFLEQSINKSKDPLFKEVAYVALVDIMQTHLQDKVALFESGIKESAAQAFLMEEVQLRLEKADEFQKAARSILQSYKKCDEKLRDPQVQTTAAVVLQKVAKIYVDLDMNKDAAAVLEIASKEIVLDRSNQFYDLKRLFAEKGDGAVLYLPSDCGFLRKRNMRICHKEILKAGEAKPQPYYELTMELPEQVREQIHKMAGLVPDAQKSTVASEYYPKRNEVYCANLINHKGESEVLKVGTDLKISMQPGVDVFIGNDQKYWNQYTSLRVRIRADTPMQEVQETLSKIGLPMALLPSREVDMRNEMLARSLAFRFPKIYYAELPHKLTPDQAYSILTAEQKAVVDNDINSAKVTFVGKNYYELVQPQIGDEAWKGGVRSLGHFMESGNGITQVSALMKSILTKGLLSSTERFQNGILNLGCAPEWNNELGSANQVFGRYLTKNFFDKEFEMNKFPLRKNLFIILDPRVLERMPYSYLKDRGGVRNPYKYEKKFEPEGQQPEKNFYGHQMMKEREGFSDTLKELNEELFPLNEAMFDLNVGADYIRKLIVWNESDRYNLLVALQQAQITHIGSTPIEEAVMIGDKLSPEFIDGYDHEEHPNLKGGKDDIKYI